MLREGLLKYWWLLYRHSKLLDQRTDIFRNIEDAYTAGQGDLCLKPESVYLDIGSGSSPVPTFLYQRHGCATYATETDSKYLKRQKDYAKKLRFGRAARFSTRAEDATRLNFPHSSLDFVTAISTIEHIPGEGDRRSMAEFARVLRPGGKLVVTVPAAAEYSESASTFYYAGFERRYDLGALEDRLCHPALKLVDQLYMVHPPADFMTAVNEQFGDVFGDKGPTDVWYQNQWHEQYPDVSIVLTLGLIRLSPVATGSFGALLTFEKQ
jgi:ubiquinone/menaquinone biosynthesis C-methylase UbiE